MLGRPPFAVVAMHSASAYTCEWIRYRIGPSVGLREHIPRVVYSCCRACVPAKSPYLSEPKFSCAPYNGGEQREAFGAAGVRRRYCTCGCEWFEYTEFGQILSKIKSSSLKSADPSIDYQPGVEFTIKLTKALIWTPMKDANTASTITPSGALSALVNQHPYRTVALKPPSPSDVTNLMLIGTKNAIEAAFKEAGWFASDPLDRASTMQTAQAIIENRGYSEAPMSVLTLNGNPPDMRYENQSNTFA
ncbi:MAG: LssY C-terminal domain-containing protein [Bryobacteraceae bacterium]